MGCTTSTETGEPSKTSNKRHPERGTMGRMNFKVLDDLDQARINLILDYWYDEGPSDGTGGNSINYTDKMLQLRQGVLDDNPGILGNADQLEPVIQKSMSQESQQKQESGVKARGKITTPSTNNSTAQSTDAQALSIQNKEGNIEQMQKSDSSNIAPIVNEREEDDDPNGMSFQQQIGVNSLAMHQTQTVPQKQPDLPPDEITVMEDTNQTPKNLNGKRLHLIPSSASSQQQSRQISPSKKFIQDNTSNVVETRGEEAILSRGNDSILDDSIGKENGLALAKSFKWDRNSKMPPQMMKRWFGGGPQTDAEVTLLFKQDLIDIGHHKLDHWQGDKTGKLATIILCDQLSRNIYRGFAEAFSFDHISLKLSKQIISNIEVFNSYALFEKIFIIAPLMHSEDVNDCNWCAEVLQEIIDQLRHQSKEASKIEKQSSAGNKSDKNLFGSDQELSGENSRSQTKNDDLIRIIEMNKRWCLEHLDILQSFGRYPHRNKVLGRENTEEEDLYLRDAASFGQNNR